MQLSAVSPRSASSASSRDDALGRDHRNARDSLARSLREEIRRHARRADRRSRKLDEMIAVVHVHTASKYHLGDACEHRIGAPATCAKTLSENRLARYAVQHTDSYAAQRSSSPPLYGADSSALNSYCAARGYYSAGVGTKPFAGEVLRRASTCGTPRRRRTIARAAFFENLARHRTQVPHDAEPRQHLQNVERDVVFPPVEPLTSRRGEAVVVVVPPLTDRDDREEPVVAAVVRRRETAIAEHVRQAS